MVGEVDSAHSAIGNHSKKLDIEITMLSHRGFTDMELIGRLNISG